MSHNRNFVLAVALVLLVLGSSCSVATAICSYSYPKGSKCSPVKYCSNKYCGGSKAESFGWYGAATTPTGTRCLGPVPASASLAMAPAPTSRQVGGPMLLSSHTPSTLLCLLCSVSLKTACAQSCYPRQAWHRGLHAHALWQKQVHHRNYLCR
jgi:hypothetical protein